MEHVYEDCPELHLVDALIENHYLKGDYKTCFRGCMKLALKGYALAECQVGWFYLKGKVWSKIWRKLCTGRSGLCIMAIPMHRRIWRKFRDFSNQNLFLDTNAAGC